MTEPPGALTSNVHPIAGEDRVAAIEDNILAGYNITFAGCQEYGDSLRVLQRT